MMLSTESPSNTPSHQATNTVGQQMLVEQQLSHPLKFEVENELCHSKGDPQRRRKRTPVCNRSCIVVACATTTSPTCILPVRIAETTFITAATKKEKSMFL
jgi:hypothetical protein